MGPACVCVPVRWTGVAEGQSQSVDEDGSPDTLLLTLAAGPTVGSSESDHLGVGSSESDLLGDPPSPWWERGGEGWATQSSFLPGCARCRGASWVDDSSWQATRVTRSRRGGKLDVIGG